MPGYSVQTPSQHEIWFYIIVWVVICTMVVIRNVRTKALQSNISLMYIANFALIHLIAAFLYVMPWYIYGSEQWMVQGFKEATCGVVGFGLGYFLIGGFLLNRIFLPQPMMQKTNTISEKLILSRLPRLYFILGVTFYFLLPLLIERIATLGALISSGQNLMTIGVCLLCLQAWLRKDEIKLRRWFLFSFLFPFITITLRGFLGYGTSMFIIAFIFTVKFLTPRWKILLVSFVVMYLGLGLYITYMRDRVELRSVIWDRRTDIKVKITSVADTVARYEFFNPFSLQHLEQIDARLNQNVLVGAAVAYIGQGGAGFARGATFWEAVLALVPRVLWPQKSVVAGSPGLVSRYTGLTFAKGTSVGIGRVMEFYVNFGSIGVLIGFMLTGFVILLIERKANFYLTSGNFEYFVIWFLPGLSLIIQGGSLVEIASSAGAGVVVAYLVTSRYRHLIIFLLVLLVAFGLLYGMLSG